MTNDKEKTRMRKLLAFAVCGVAGPWRRRLRQMTTTTVAEAAEAAAATSPAPSASTARARSRPFAQAAAEEFQGQNPNVKITVGTSGTGGGFEKFCAGETDISDASRPIEDDEIADLQEERHRPTRRSRSPTTASPS